MEIATYAYDYVSLNTTFGYTISFTTTISIPASYTVADNFSVNPFVFPFPDVASSVQILSYKYTTSIVS